MFGADPQKSRSLGRIVDQRHWDRVASLLERSGGDIIAGGLLNSDRADCYIPPTLVTGVAQDAPLMTQVRT